jgi:hypothetical protein
VTSSILLAMFALAFADTDCAQSYLYSGQAEVAQGMLYPASVAEVHTDSGKLDVNPLPLAGPRAGGATSEELAADLGPYLSLHKQAVEQGTGGFLTPWLQLRSAGEAGPAPAYESQSVLGDLSDECS